MKRTTTNVLTLGVAFLILTGCSSPEVEPAPSTSSATVTETPAPEPSPVPEGVETSGRESTLPIIGVAVDTLGDYNRITIDETDPAMVFDKSAVTEETLEAYTEEEILDFQQTMVRYIAEEVIDSPVNVPDGDPKKTIEEFEKWWEENKDRMHPSQQEVLHDAVTDNPTGTTFLTMSQWRNKDNASDLGTTYTTIRNDDNTRVTDLDIDVAEITSGTEEGMKYMSLKADVKYFSPIDNGKTNAVERVDGAMLYTAVLEDGEWLIAGHDGKTTATIITEEVAEKEITP